MRVLPFACVIAVLGAAAVPARPRSMPRGLPGAHVFRLCLRRELRTAQGWFRLGRAPWHHHADRLRGDRPRTPGRVQRIRGGRTGPVRRGLRLGARKRGRRSVPVHRRRCGVRARVPSVRGPIAQPGDQSMRRSVAEARRGVSSADPRPVSSAGDSRRPAPQPEPAFLGPPHARVERLPDHAVHGRAALREAARVHQGHPRGRGQRVPALGAAALRLSLAVEQAAVRPHSVRPVRRMDHRARLARRDQHVLCALRRGLDGQGAVVQRLQRRAEFNLPAGLLVRALLRHQVLRDAAETARGGAAGLGAGAGGAGQDAALPAEPAFHVQHAERDLDADPRRPGQGRQPGDRAVVGFPALHARPGPDEEGDAAPGTRRAQPLPGHRAASLR